MFGCAEPSAPLRWRDGLDRIAVSAQHMLHEHANARVVLTNRMRLAGIGTPLKPLCWQAAYCAIAYKDASAYRLAHHRFGANRAPMAERRAVLPLEYTGTTAPMPRYFFHVTDGADYPDSEGIILDDVASARAEAITTAGALLKDRGATFWGSGEWRMTVVDEAGGTVCRLRFAAE